MLKKNLIFVNGMNLQWRHASGLPDEVCLGIIGGNNANLFFSNPIFYQFLCHLHRRRTKNSLQQVRWLGLWTNLSSWETYLSNYVSFNRVMYNLLFSRLQSRQFICVKINIFISYHIQNNHKHKGLKMVHNLHKPVLIKITGRPGSKTCKHKYKIQTQIAFQETVKVTSNSYKLEFFFPT